MSKPTTDRRQFYFNVRKKGARQWVAYSFPSRVRPALKRGYEMTGPHNNLIAALIAANEPARTWIGNSGAVK